MRSVLCIALNPAVDLATDAATVEPTHKMRTRGDTLHPGGGGVNVARMIAEMGGAPQLAYLSGGETGALLDRLLRELPIGLQRIKSGTMVRIATTVHEERTGFEYRFVPEGFPVAADLVEPVLDRVRLGSFDYVVASGSLPPGLDVETYSHIADACARAGSRFVLDTSGPALRNAAFSTHAYLIKPSLGELEKLSGNRMDEDGAHSAAMEIVERGNADHVAVSMGAEGALLVGKDLRLRMPARHVPVRSAVGAGDSFLGAMVHALACDASISEALTWGIAAGAAAVTTTGTALCTKAQVEDIRAEMERSDAA